MPTVVCGTVTLFYMHVCELEDIYLFKIMIIIIIIITIKGLQIENAHINQDNNYTLTTLTHTHKLKQLTKEEIEERKKFSPCPLNAQT